MARAGGGDNRFEPMPMNPAAAEAPLSIACLCAAWCSACTVWRPLFDGLAAAGAAGEAWRWIDIEDEDDLVGELEIENFPTLLIARGPTPLFYGPVVPQPAGVVSLVAHARAGRLAPITQAATVALALRLTQAGGA